MKMQFLKLPKVLIFSTLVLGPVVFLVLSVLYATLHPIMPTVVGAKFSPITVITLGIIAGIIAGRFSMSSKGNASVTLSKTLLITTPIWFVLSAPIIELFIWQTKYILYHIVSGLVYAVFLSACSAITAYLAVIVYEPIESL